MDCSQALKALLAQAEAGTVLRSADAFDAFQMVLGGRDIWLHACKASQGSLDAAKAMHDAALPGWRALISAHLAWVDIWDPTNTATINTPIRAGATDPARAWLMAILRALIAQEAAE